MNYDNLLNSFTDKEALILSQLAYMNLLPAVKDKIPFSDKVGLREYKNRSLKSIAQELLDADLKLSSSDYNKIVDPNNKESIDTPYQAIAASVGRGCVTRTQFREIMNTIIEDEKLGSLC